LFFTSFWLLLKIALEKIAKSDLNLSFLNIISSPFNNRQSSFPNAGQSDLEQPPTQPQPPVRPPRHRDTPSVNLLSLASTPSLLNSNNLSYLIGPDQNPAVRYSVPLANNNQSTPNNTDDFGSVISFENFM
jgi:hypothetical protein